MKRVAVCKGSAAEHLTRTFYARPTLVVARELLGKILVRVGDDGVRRSGRIVETEAYVGPDDLASHARIGPRGRGVLMYGQAGIAYVFLVYGMHNCFNAVTERDGYPGAVLVRAVEPLEHLERGSGPALVCRGLGIDRACTGVDLTTSASLFARRTRRPSAMGTSGLVRGSASTTPASGPPHPWRFWVAGSPHVSRPRVTGLRLDPSTLT